MRWDGPKPRHSFFFFSKVIEFAKRIRPDKSANRHKVGDLVKSQKMADDSNELMRFKAVIATAAGNFEFLFPTEESAGNFASNLGQMLKIDCDETGNELPSLMDVICPPFAGEVGQPAYYPVAGLKDLLRMHDGHITEVVVFEYGEPVANNFAWKYSKHPNPPPHPLNPIENDDDHCFVLTVPYLPQYRGYEFMKDSKLFKNPSPMVKFSGKQ